MNQNNYAPPKAALNVALERPNSSQFRLHNLWSICVATFFGSPFAAGLLVYQNLAALGLRRKALHALGWFSAAGLLAVYRAWHTPPDAISIMLAVQLPQLIAASLLAIFLQGTALSKYRAAGGRMSSSWHALATGIAVGLAIRALFYVVTQIVG